MARLDREELARTQAEADRVIAAALAGHLVHRPTSGDRPNAPWRLDPIPYVIEWDEFEHLAAGVRQRVQAMEQLLADLYGPRRSVREGWVPAEALAASPRYRLAMIGVPAPPRWLTSYAVDVVAGTDGSWRVVQDLTDTPTGVGYAQLDRSVMARVAAALLGTAGRPGAGGGRRLPGRAAPRAGRRLGRAEPAHRPADERDRRPGVRGALVAGPAARLPPGPGGRPGRTGRAAVVARARRAGADRRGLPPPVGRRPRPDRDQRHRPDWRPRAHVGGRRGRCDAGQRPRRRRAGGRRSGPLLAGGHQRPHRDAAGAGPARRRGAGRRAGVHRRPCRLGAGGRAAARRGRPERGQRDGRWQRSGAGTRRCAAPADGAGGQGRVGGRRRAGGAPGPGPSAGRPGGLGPDPRRRCHVLARAIGGAGRGDRPNGCRRHVTIPSGPGPGRARWGALGPGDGARAAPRRRWAQPVNRGSSGPAPTPTWTSSWRGPRRRRRPPGRGRGHCGNSRRVPLGDRRTGPRPAGGRGAGAVRRADPDRRSRRRADRPRLAGRVVERERRAWPGVAVRRSRPAHRAFAGGARPARRHDRPSGRGGRPRRRSRHRGAAGGQREPRRLPPQVSQRRRTGPGGRPPRPRGRQPPIVRRLCRSTGRARGRRRLAGGGRRGRRAAPLDRRSGRTARRAASDRRCPTPSTTSWWIGGSPRRSNRCWCARRDVDGAGGASRRPPPRRATGSATARRTTTNRP